MRISALRQRPRPRGCLFLLLLIPALICCASLIGFALLPLPPLGILIVGLDARPGEGTLARADAILLLGISSAPPDIGLMSIPRDLFFETPGYGEQRINAVHMLGETTDLGQGVSLMQSALNDALSIRLNRHIRVDFEGFIALVDSVGGVLIDIPRPIIDYAYPSVDGTTTTISFDPGPQILDGTRALIYARTRHSDDDYQRTTRQQQVIAALAQKLIQPWHWPAAFTALRTSINSDLNLFDYGRIGTTYMLRLGHIDRLVIDRAQIASTPAGNPTIRVQSISDWLRHHFYR